MNCRQPNNLHLSTGRRLVIYIIGIVESSLLAGTVFGWPQLVHVLRTEGIYADLCEPSPPPSPSAASESFLESVITSSSSPFVSGLESVLPASPPSLAYNITTSSSPPLPFSPSSAVNNTVDSIPPTPPFVFNTNCHHSANSSYDIPGGSQHEQCGPQDERFALIFAVSVGCYSVPGVLIGYLLHHAGLRITRVSAGTMMTMSFLFLGMSTKDSPNYLFPAMILMGLAGNQLRMSVMQFGDLFPRHRSTAITLLSGMYAASASVFLVFQVTADAGVSRAVVCWVMASLSSLTVLSSFIMPVHHIPVTDHTYEVSREQDKKDSLPLGKSLWSLSSFLHQCWFFVSLFAINIYQQTYNVWVNRTSCSVEEAGMFSALFSYSSLVTVFVSPVGGVFTDYLVRKAKNTEDEVSRRVKEVQASFWPLLVTTASIGLLSVCEMVFSPASVYFSLLCLVIARPCAIAMSTAYLRIRFPADHFNRLLGFYATVTSLLMIVQYPHFIWAQHTYYVAHGFVVVLVLLTVTNPLHLLVTSYMRRAIVARDGPHDPVGSTTYSVDRHHNNHTSYNNGSPLQPPPPPSHEPLLTTSLSSPPSSSQLATMEKSVVLA